MAKRTSKRELIDTGRNKMFARRDVQGRFKEMDDVGRFVGGRSEAHRHDHGDIGPRRSRRPPASGNAEEELPAQTERATAMRSESKPFIRPAASCWKEALAVVADGSHHVPDPLRESQPTQCKNH